MRKHEKDWRLKYEANIKYEATTTKRFTFKFNRNTDADILEALETTPNKLGFVKEAIRFYLAHKDDIAE